jgi:hypothetical protein
VDDDGVEHAGGTASDDDDDDDDDDHLIVDDGDGGTLIGRGVGAHNGSVEGSKGFKGFQTAIGSTSTPAPIGRRRLDATRTPLQPFAAGSTLYDRNEDGKIVAFRQHKASWPPAANAAALPVDNDFYHTNYFTRDARQTDRGGGDARPLSAAAARRAWDARFLKTDDSDGVVSPRSVHVRNRPLADMVAAFTSRVPRLTTATTTTTAAAAAAKHTRSVEADVWVAKSKATSAANAAADALQSRRLLATVVAAERRDLGALSTQSIRESVSVPDTLGVAAMRDRLAVFEPEIEAASTRQQEHVKRQQQQQLHRQQQQHAWSQGFTQPSSSFVPLLFYQKQQTQRVVPFHLRVGEPPS